MKQQTAFGGRSAHRDGDGDAAGEQLAGKITRLFFSNEKFSAGVLEDADRNTHKFAGPVAAEVGDRVRFTGKWSDHERFGRQFSVESWSFDEQLDAAGLADFIARSKAFRGIGPKRARDLVKAAGADFEQALEDPQGLAARSGLSLEVVEGVREAWLERSDLNRTMAALTTFGVGPKAAQRLWSQFGASVVGIIRKDPYWLIGRVSGIGFKTIDEYALASGVHKTHPTRIAEGILFCLKEATGDGHTWTARRELLDSAESLLILDELDGRSRIELALDELVERSRIVELVHEGTQACWLPWIYEAETYVLDVLQRHGRRELDWERILGFRPTLEKVRELDPQLNEDQAAAVVNALLYYLSIMTGGAGVGKTFTIEAIIRIFSEAGLTVALCAPTGKAAKRAAESTGHAAKTMHRMLNAQAQEGPDGELEFGFEHNELNPLPADVIIVDEVSMVDIELFAHFFKAVDWTRTSVVLVGDHNQLPPVGPGSVLRDCVSAKPDRNGVSPYPVGVLSQVVRQAGALKHNINGILEGRVESGSSRGSDGTMIEPWYVIDQFEDASQLAGFIEVMFAHRLATYTIVDRNTGETRNVDPVWDVQLLVPMKKGKAGINELNVRLQRIRQAKLGVEVAPPAKDGGRTKLYPEDKVIWTRRNDRDLGLMNGTMGRVIGWEVRLPGPIDPDDEDFSDIPAFDPGKDDLDDMKPVECLVCEFEGTTKGKRIAVPKSKVTNIELAYAMTVHKAQGSECPIAVVVMHKSQSYMHHRGLFYTAVSRARVSTIIVGDRWAIRECAKVVKSDKRRTAINLLDAGFPGELLAWQPKERDDGSEEEDDVTMSTEATTA